MRSTDDVGLVAGRTRALLGPPLVWLLVVMAMFGAAGWVVTQQRALLDRDFDQRVDVAAGFTNAYLVDHTDRQREWAVQLLSDPVVDQRSLEKVRLGLKFDSAAVLDSKGRVLVIAPAKPELVGQDITVNLPFLQRALVASWPQFSPVIRSLVLPETVVGVAVSYDTPLGRRVLSGGYAVQTSPLGVYLGSAIGSSSSLGNLIDSAGSVVAGTSPTGKDIVPLAAQDPALAQALAGGAFGRYSRGGQEWGYASHSVGETGWRLVAAVRGSVLHGPADALQRQLSIVLLSLTVVGFGGASLLARSWDRQLRAQASTRQLNRDLSERNHEIQQANGQLVESSRDLKSAVDELETFNYTAAHDLRAPLRAINGWVDVLMEDHVAVLDADGQDALSEVRSGSLRMGQLVDDLLAFSKLGQGDLHRASVDPVTIARRAAASLASEMRDRQVELDIRPMAPAVADASLLQQVYVNLLSNALKFSRDRQPARIGVGAREREDQVVYYVQDNGIGFEMRYAEQVFGVFHGLHTRDRFEGTGIGLAIVRRIVERHGGRIWAESEPDRGATFLFTLRGDSS
jgi:signal transduction histidine kinase